MFRRARIIAGGQIIEDIDDFNRLSLMFTALKSQDDQKEIAMEGFGLFDRKYDRPAGGLLADPDAEDDDERKIYRVSDWDEAGTIGKSRTVLFKPMLGFLAQEKLIPLRYCPLQIELELVNSGSDCMFVGEQNGQTSTNKWSVSDIQCKCDLLLSIQVFKMNMQVIFFLESLFLLILVRIITRIKPRMVIKTLVATCTGHLLV